MHLILAYLHLNPLFIAELATILEGVRAVVREELTNQGVAEPLSKAFSAVGSTEAENLLVDLELQEVDGNAMDPIVVPAVCPTCSPFDYSQYARETDGNKPCLDHHMTQLLKHGVSFGRDAFKMYDLHKTSSLYTIRTRNGMQYRGNVDGCLAPYGLMLTSASRQSRIIYEHKQSSLQKELQVQGIR